MKDLVFDLQSEDPNVVELKNGIEMCLDWLLKGAPNNHSEIEGKISFDMDYWDTPSDIVHNKKTHHCGTVMCIGGFITQVTSLKYLERLSHSNPYGPEWDTLDYLFRPYKVFKNKDWSITKTIKVLRHFLATNKINWDL